MDKMTLFAWGYYGWGNATPQLVEAVDAVETSRGFKPPQFVDIRIRRAVRAKGFQGNAFEKLLGPSRHRWMKSLGNKFIQTRTGPNIQIADPRQQTNFLTWPWNLPTTSSDSCSFAVASGPGAMGRSPVIERRSLAWCWKRRRSVVWRSRS